MSKRAINLSRLTPSACRLQQTARPRQRACALRPRVTDRCVRAVGGRYAPCSTRCRSRPAIVGLTRRRALGLIAQPPLLRPDRADAATPAMIRGDLPRIARSARSAQFIRGFLADPSSAPDELDSATARASARAISEIKLAPLSPMRDGRAALPAQRRRPHGRGPGRAHSARRDAARQPDRPAQPPGLHRDDRERRRVERRATANMRCWWSTCCASAGSTRAWAPGRRRTADHLRPPADLGAARPATCWRGPAATSSACWSALQPRHRGRAGRGRAHPGGDGDAVQAVASWRSASNARSASR